MSAAALIALLVGAGAISSPVFGTILWHQVSEGRRLVAARRDWKKYADRRGLTGGESPTSGGAWQLAYSGAMRGRVVTLAAQTSMPVHGWTHVRALLHPTLDLGLHAAPDPASHLPRVGPTRPLIAADEPERITRMFDADLLPRVRALGATDWTIGDFGVLLRFPMFVPDPRSLDASVERVLDLCDALDRARSRIGPASSLHEHAGAWRRFAESRGLDVLTAPLAMAGSIDGVAVSASARRTDRLTYGLGAEARFARPLGGAVGLVPTGAGGVARWLDVATTDLGGEDWTLDDPPFDAAFLVRARDPAKLSRILPPELRRTLLRMHERTPLVVDDHAIRIAAERLPDPSAVAETMTSLAHVAGELEARVHEGGGSPYR